MSIFSFLSKNKKKKKPQMITTSAVKNYSRLKKLFKSEKQDMTSFFQELEEILLTADISITTTTAILEDFQTSLTKKEVENSLNEEFKKILYQKLIDKEFTLQENNVNIILVFGINGVGKTTSVAKLCHYFTSQGKSVVVAAADTYRAAASLQLKQWIDEMGQQLVHHEGKSKPSAVVFDALDSVIARKKDILIIDTAGRIHSREDLLAELDKLKQIIIKKTPLANIIHLLVLDATTGQNSLSQAEHFDKSVGIEGVFLSKMDSSGKGGVALNLSYQMNIPIFFTGTGEKKEDINLFDRKKYIDSLF